MAKHRFVSNDARRPRLPVVLILHAVLLVPSQRKMEDPPVTCARRVGVRGILGMLVILHACAASINLHAAAEQGDAASLRAALAAGEDPNTRDADSYTPIHLSAGMGAADALSALLDDPRTEVDATDDVGESPLHLAAAAGRTEAAGRLLLHGARGLRLYRN